MNNKFSIQVKNRQLRKIIQSRLKLIKRFLQIRKYDCKIQYQIKLGMNDKNIIHYLQQILCLKQRFKIIILLYYLLIFKKYSNNIILLSYILLTLSTHMELSQDEIAKNIQALKNKIGDARTGGKGSQRRKVKVVPKAVANDDKKIKTIVKKLGVQPLQAIDEVNFFKDDNSVLHFTNPDVLASVQSNTFVIVGNPQTKTIKDLLPDVIQQLGPKQFATLKDLISTNATNESTGKQEQAPTLVPTSFEQTAKVE